MWNINFISENDFTEHVKNTIKNYGEKLKPFDLKKFNINIIDPIKLIFDKLIYKYTWDEIIKNEIYRQRDKSNNNDIGYFHQRIFQYIKNCEVPRTGWDVIFFNDDGIKLPEGDIIKKIYIEMKNKHNTLNSSAGAKTYIKMQNKLLEDDNCACFLVEVIAKRSQNIIWSVNIDGKKFNHRKIRRVSIDQFYKIITGQGDAFYKICMVLPDVIAKIVKSSEIQTPKDTVISELKNISEHKNILFILALYLLGFGTYINFS
mgnify:CR=1 FL=1